MATKKKAPERGAMSKFVKAHLRKGTSPQEIVKLGEAEGLQIAPSLIYNIRSQQAKAEGRAPAKRGRPPKAATPSAPTPASASDLEPLIRQAIVEIGVRGVHALVDKVAKGML